MFPSTQGREAAAGRFLIRSDGLSWVRITGAPVGKALEPENREAAAAWVRPPHSLSPDAQKGASARSSLQLLLEAMEFRLVLAKFHIVADERS